MQYLVDVLPNETLAGILVKPKQPLRYLAKGFDSEKFKVSKTKFIIRLLKPILVKICSTFSSIEISGGIDHKGLF